VHHLRERVVAADAEQQVHVVGHQAVVIEADGELRPCFLDESGELREPRLLEEELTVVASQGDVVRPRPIMGGKRRGNSYAGSGKKRRLVMVQADQQKGGASWLDRIGSGP
jgi:hypothetical protein